MHILLILFLFILILGFSLVGSVIRFLTAPFRRFSNNQEFSGSNTNKSNRQRATWSDDDAMKGETTHRKKIFDKDEGEYVDFEEIPSSDEK